MSIEHDKSLLITEADKLRKVAEELRQKLDYYVERFKSRKN